MELTLPGLATAALLAAPLVHIASGFSLRAAAEEVVITSADGVSVHGTLQLPEGDIFESVPGVLLLHGGRQDRSEWKEMLPRLHQRGWATLAIDLRGHGATGGEIEDWAEFFQSADGVPKDVEAAMAFFGAHESVDAARIAVLGSSVGGNLACAAVQNYGAIGGVSMGGKTAAAKSLAGGELDGLHSMLFVAGEKEQQGQRAAWAKELSAMGTGATRALVVEGAEEHGALLLAGREDLSRAIVDHLGGVLAAGKRKEIEFPSADGLLVTADMYGPHPVSAPWIVVAHQAGWSRGEYRDTAPRLTTLGFNVLALDQRSGGEINGVTNQTAARAKEKGLPMEYIHGEPDIIAGLGWVRELGAKKVVLLGSSYSASLAIKIAAETEGLVDEVVSFSPGEYSGEGSPELIATAAAKLSCPVWITSAKGEGDMWRPILDAVPGKVGEQKFSYLPQADGQHGSRALWSQFDGSRALWAALTVFLTR